MITEVLDDDILGMDGQIAPPRRGRPASDEAKRRVNVLFADKGVSDPPSETWWLGLTDRESFRRQQIQEQERMQTSKFGRMKGNIPESPA